MTANFRMRNKNKKNDVIITIENECGILATFLTFTSHVQNQSIEVIKTEYFAYDKKNETILFIVNKGLTWGTIL